MRHFDKDGDGKLSAIEVKDGAIATYEGIAYTYKEVEEKVNVTVEVCDTIDSPFTQNLETGTRLTMPVAHNEGNYFVGEDKLARLNDNRQIAFRYTDGSAHGPANPNGSSLNITGIVSANGRVMGMMPHPERAISPELGGSDGATLLQGCLEALAS